MRNWHLTEKEPSLSENYKKSPLVSYKRGRSLKDILVRAKLWKGYLKHALGSRVGLSTPFYTKSVLKCNWHAFLMFSSDGSWSRGTSVDGPILKYFWRLPSTWLDNLCTAIPSLPPAAAAAPLSIRLFFGYLLLVIVPRLFPFRHVARRNVARAIDWSEKKRTRNASLRARNSGLWRCGARDFFFLQIKSLFVNFHKTNKLYNQIK